MRVRVKKGEVARAGGLLSLLACVPSPSHLAPILLILPSQGLELQAEARKLEEQSHR